jgi:Tfp pilus assembly protein PilZ
MSNPAIVFGDLMVPVFRDSCTFIAENRTAWGYPIFGRFGFMQKDAEFNFYRVLDCIMNEGRILKSNQERRRHKRIIYEANVSHSVASSDAIHSGKMFNFSKRGIYFESDQSLQPGQDIALGIAASAEAYSNDINFLFDVKIIWRKALEDSQFGFGYGGKLLNAANSKLDDGNALPTAVPTLPFDEIKPERESRQHSRRPYNKSLKFRHNNVEYAGFVANIGRGGALILTEEQFAIGGRITLIVPGIHTGKKVKVTGRIVRLTPDGIGVRFEDRSGRERRGDMNRRTGQDRRDSKRRKD